MISRWEPMGVGFWGTRGQSKSARDARPIGTRRGVAVGRLIAETLTVEVVRTHRLELPLAKPRIAHGSWSNIIGTWTAVAMLTACHAPETSEPLDRAAASRSIDSAAQAELAECDSPRCCDEASDSASPVAVLPTIRARLRALVARFDDELPAKSEIIRFFDPDGFYHNGLGLDAYLDSVLLKARITPGGFDFVGFTFSDLKVDQVVDASHVFVTYTVSVKHSSSVRFRPWTERMLMTRVCGHWRLSGNQQIALASVGFRARLVEKPITQAELNTRPDVYTEIQTWDPLQRAAYLMRIPVPFSSDLIGWIGFPGDTTFGVIAWVGNGFDLWWTPDVNERELRRQYNQYLASPSSRVRAYMVFEVSSTEIDPRVSYVHVTGPGLPSVGLNLVRSDPQFPRDYLIFRGDQLHWDAFSTERCASMAKLVDDANDQRDFIPDCALDWSQIASGSSYVYSFHDAGGSVLGQKTLELRGELLGEAGWYAARDRFFGQFTLDPSFQFTMSNVLDTSAGSPFVGGGRVSLKWRLPTNPEVLPEGVSYWRQYYLNDDFFNEPSRREEENRYQLYGSRATSLLATTEPNAFLTTWAWCTLSFRDAFGNWFDHEVAPVNPR